MELLKGHPSAPLAEPVRGWLAFAAAYRAELDALPFLARFAMARQVVAWLRDYDTITILSGEQRVPQGSAPDYWAQRHIFREWLCTLVPLAQPLGAAACA
jgi:hypothetical protein